ncbi:ureidoglycolate lyase [Marimonas arenosa]|uniref:Ureidoglycolate lyase n=1 Tax=Marimonas arenosa TaxID=1795305 RepID=A0AAE3WDR8_9RHOB|nr:ureidoglycolate lyase [Marimonas arenosa]MDQ2089852.1 ureidoglycolate lyase [Marimonas arenosa]
MIRIVAQSLTAASFAPFGDVLEAAGEPDRIINAGLCGRWHDQATLDFGPDGRVGISVFLSEPRALPYTLDLLERHPDGSQAFIPMHGQDWLVIAAPDNAGKPGKPQAFLASGRQGVNFHRGTWHGVLTPLAEPGLFTVVDRIGDTPNLEEYRLDPPYAVMA